MSKLSDQVAARVEQELTAQAQGMPPIQLGAHTGPMAAAPPDVPGAHPAPAAAAPMVGAVPWRAILPAFGRFGKIASQAALQALAAELGPQAQLILAMIEKNTHLFQGAPPGFDEAVGSLREIAELAPISGPTFTRSAQAPAPAAPSVPPKDKR